MVLNPATIHELTTTVEQIVLLSKSTLSPDEDLQYAVETSRLRAKSNQNQSNPHTARENLPRLIVSKVKTRPVLLLSHPGHILHGYILIFWLSWSPKQRNLNVLHYHGVYICEHKTVLKILVKRNKNTKNPAIKFETIKKCKSNLKNIWKSVTLSLQGRIYHDFFFFHASLTYR